MKSRLMMSVLVASSVAACSSMKVTTLEAPGVAQRVAEYRTYAWVTMPEKRDAYHDPAIGAQVRTAVDRELSMKGYQLVEQSAKPDFLVAYHTTAQQKVNVEQINPYYGYGWDPVFGPPLGYGGAGQGTYEIRHYQEGTLILDVVDGASNKLVWRGDAVADLGTAPSSKDVEKKIDKATEQILAKFPPRT